MSFAIRMALREMRRGRKRFAFFLLCIAIGVAGLVAIKGFNANIQAALLREARTLMAADMTLSLSRQPAEEQVQALMAYKEQGIDVIPVTETPSMARSLTGDTTLVDVKAVAPGYPFYGVLEVTPADAALRDDTALIAPELADRIGLKAGDTMKLGNATFTVAGVILKEPDKVAAGFAMGPRVMITQGGLAKAGLIQVGSRATFKYLFKLANDEQVETIRAEVREIFKDQRPRLADFREAQPQVRRFLDRMTSFLSLVSMVALLIGGLGVANATRVFIQQKMDAIAVMKCMGATNRKVIGVYLTQMLFLSLAGSLLGVIIGYAIQLALPGLVREYLDVELLVSLSPEVAIQGLTVGLLTAVLFTLLPLTAIADVKPAQVFRREMAESRPPKTWQQWGRESFLLALTAVGLGLIAGWVSGSYRWGFWFMAGLIGAVLLLYGASWAAVRLVRAIRPPRGWLTVRQGLANLHRPGSQASAVVLALGVGVTMVLAVFLLQRGLMREVELTTPAGTPNVFFVGLQRPDAEAFAEFIKAQPGVEHVPDPIPMVQGRLVRIDGKTKDQLTLTQDEERWFNFQFNLTYSEELPAGNELIKGAWWTEADWQAEKLVSVEQEAATRLHLDIGSTVEMEVAGGVPVTVKVASIRRTTDFRAGGSFNFILAPGTLDQAPVSFLAQARVRPDAVGALQKETVARFPAITVINLNDVLEQVTGVLTQISLVIRFVAGFSVIAGLIILASSIVATKFRRTREAVLFKTLGATRGRVWRIFAMEYAALGLVAGVVGAGLSAVAAWVVLREIMEMTYQLEILPLLAGVGVTVVLTVVVGVISTLDVLAAKPLQVLREE